MPEEWIMLIASTPTLAALATQWLAFGNFRIAERAPFSLPFPF